MTIYVASKCIHGPMWRQYRACGAPIISSWIYESGEGESASYPDLAARCIHEASIADVTVLFCRRNEILKGALIEVGVALGSGKQVRCVGDCDSISRVFREHPHWRTFLSLEEALTAPLMLPRSGAECKLCGLPYEPDHAGLSRHCTCQ